MLRDCVVELIIAKKEKSCLIFEDDNFIAFLDHCPVFFGHTLVAPKEHFTTFYDLPLHLIEPLFSLTKKIGKAVEFAMEAGGSFIAINNVVSQSIPHLHIHIIPRIKGDGLKGFFWPRHQYKNAEHMVETQHKIIKVLSATS